MLTKLESLLEINMLLKSMNEYLETQIFINTVDNTAKMIHKKKRFIRKNKATNKTIYRERY